MRGGGHEHDCSIRLPRPQAIAAPDADRVAAVRVGGRDDSVPTGHQRDAERINGVHGPHGRPAVELYLMVGWSAGEGVGDRHRDVSGGCVALTLGPVQCAFAQVLAPGFDPGLVLQLLESEGGTFFFGVPTMLIAVLDHPDLPGRDLSSVRLAGSGGATVPAALVRRVESTLDARASASARRRPFRSSPRRDPTTHPPIGLISRSPHSHCYRLTSLGRRVAVLFTKAHGRVLAPGLALLDPVLPLDVAAKSPLGRAWRQLDNALEDFVARQLIAA